MPRSLSPTFLAQLGSSGVSQPLLFVQLIFANEILYLFNGVGTFTPTGPAYSATSTFPYGEVWTGLGWLGKLSNIPQTTKVQAQNITLALSGIPSELLDEAIGQVRITGSATVYLGFLNSSGALIPDPIQIFSGALDVPTLSDDGSTSTITITCENPLLSLNLAPNRLFDDADQQIYFPGDIGMSFVEDLQNLALFWPAPYAYASPWPVTMSINPNDAVVAVGYTTALTATMTYSDSSTWTLPSGGGGGPSFVGVPASSDPSIATINTQTWEVTGVKPGICLITVRSVYFGSGVPVGQRRVCCSVIVT